MTAPDPTAGEGEVPCPECGGSMRFCECMDDPFAPVPHPLGPDGFTCLAGDVAYDRLHGVDGHTQAAPPPAVAASTGTSEDVEALQRLIVSHLRADKPDEYDEAAWSAAGAVLASDWLAAREAAARAEEPTEAEEMAAAKAILHARQMRWDGPIHQGECITDARAALAAARIAREG